jgi:hypothetical protein
LVFKNGRPKPALAGFQHPFVADVVTRAPRVRFWGQVRPGRSHAVALQRRSPSGSWVTIARLKTDTRGVFVKTLLIARGQRGTYRYRTTDPLPAPVITSDALSVTSAGGTRSATSSR